MNTPTLAPAATTDQYPELTALPMVLTVQQLAEVLHVSQDLIRDHCIDGRIPHITLGDRRRIPRHVVLALLSAQS